MNSTAAKLFSSAFLSELKRVVEKRCAKPQNVVEFCEKFNLTLPKNENWWMIQDVMDPRPGYIHGLREGSSGFPRITNGIDVWIEREDGTLFKGHRDWLRWTRRGSSRSAAARDSNSEPQARQNSLIPGRYVELAKQIWMKGTVDSFAEKYAKVIGHPPMNLMLDSEEEAVETISIAVNEYMEKVTSVI